MRHAYQDVLVRRGLKCALSLRYWCAIGLTLAIGIWASPEAWAVDVSPTAVSFYAIEGAADPSSQSVSVSKASKFTANLNATDNAAWLAVSPATATITSTARVAVAAKTSGLRAGTYTATVTIKLDKGGSTVVPVSLTVVPATTLGTTSTTSSTTTSTTDPTTTSTTTSSTTSTTTTLASSTKAVSVAWDPVASSGLAGYKVYLGTAPGTYGAPIDVGNVSSSSVNNLLVGTTYYFVVTAYDSSGLESLPSVEVSKTIN